MRCSAVFMVVLHLVSLSPAGMGPAGERGRLQVVPTLGEIIESGCRVGLLSGEPAVAAEAACPLARLRAGERVAAGAWVPLAVGDL